MALGAELDKMLKGLTDEIGMLRERIEQMEAGVGTGQLAYSVKAAAKVLGCADYNIRELIRSGQLPAFHIERGKQRYLIYRVDLEEFIRRRKREG